MTQVLVPFSQGVEEVEMLSVVDLLRRAGLAVTTATPDGLPARGRSEVEITPDAALDNMLGRDWDAIVLPGGLPNAHTLRDHAGLAEALHATFEAGRLVAAICAAPVALARAGVLKGRRVTSYPGCEEDIRAEEAEIGAYLEEPVVVDGNVITSRGPGTAIPFALAIIRHLLDEEASEKVRREIVFGG